MELYTMGKILFVGGKAVDSMFGYQCPKCLKKSWFSQKEVGETWFTGKKKIKCGHCSKVFKAKKRKLQVSCIPLLVPRLLLLWNADQTLDSNINLI